ncbi:MAG: hypothetical protein GYB68_09895, partial [Chloroflexi bacterium]|nr:hypothetical protein [Chloroflexota bacterium]
MTAPTWLQVRWPKVSLTPILDWLRWRRLGHSLLVLLVGTALMLPALHPMMFGALPESPDGQLHLYRLVALDHAIDTVGLWPRFAPALHFGYGSPIFNYYAPLAMYPMVALHRIGFTHLNALLITMSVFTLLAGWGAYKLGEQWRGPLSGGIALLSYVYAPYMLYDWPRRGAVPEYAALALLPWVMWAFGQVALKGRRIDLLAAVALYALFIPLHNVTTLFGSGLLLFYAGLLWWSSEDRRKTALRLLLAFGVPIILTTVYWWPALGETAYVSLERVMERGSDFDFRVNFDSLASLFALPYPADLTQLAPPVRRVLGWPQLILGLAALAMIQWPPIKRFWVGGERDPNGLAKLQTWSLGLLRSIIVVNYKI